MKARIPQMSGLSPGFLLIDKPPGPSSRTVSEAVRKALKLRRAGHTGTLDPFASGLLILSLGSATRLSEYLLKKDKSYEFNIFLGAQSDTGDSTGAITPTADPGSVAELDVDALLAILPEFTGEIRQTPPIYSAIRVGGRRLYDYARKKEAVDIPERIVRIYSLELADFSPPRVSLKARVESGTYIRSLGRDLGERLGVGAYVESLRRTEVGRFPVEDAFAFAQGEKIDVEALRKAWLSPAAALPELRRATTRGLASERMRHGNPILMNHEELDMKGPVPGAGEPVLVFHEAGGLLALAFVREAERGIELRPRKVLGR